MITIDYRLGDLYIFQDFVRHYIHTSQTLNIICRHWVPLRLTPGSRSWLPSWMLCARNLFLGGAYGASGISGDNLVGTPNHKPYNASKGTVATAIFRAIVDKTLKEKKSLTVNGFGIGTISGISPSSSSYVPTEAMHFSGWSSADSSVPDCLWRTLVADRGPHGMKIPSWYHSACQY
ncbi:hypothetical protein BU26DRAFT_8189 [Trematosphaeria pertusa]|uniref:Uncharacterized protein n=1 Tax=Trematosphaeria pertusa TaxID=390896 RepID=A0A6A6J1L3_9PLEO|nr:uncharacterized protein BU26DRAFT_8189 [Trematosphaeria pertusa]KAF2255780.1 hypothetical protein BU26DRAFT_8189 [Trematosphaeria pertusa]